jgi:hypothetical protein
MTSYFSEYYYTYAEAKLFFLRHGYYSLGLRQEYYLSVVVVPLFPANLTMIIIADTVLAIA